MCFRCSSLSSFATDRPDLILCTASILLNIINPFQNPKIASELEAHLELVLDVIGVIVEQFFQCKSQSGK